MNKKIIKALDFIREKELKGVILAIPFTLSAKDILILRDNPLCEGLILLNPPPEITAWSSDKWLGCFENRSWILPTVRAPILFIGSHFLLTRQMATQVIKSWRLNIFCKISGGYQELPMYQFLLWRGGDRILRYVNESRKNAPLRRVIEIIKKIQLFRLLWSRIFKPAELSNGMHCSGQKFNIDLSEEALYNELLQSARKISQRASYQAIPGRVLILNAGLAAGGAERQIVNTLIGLKNSAQCESVTLLAEYIDHAPNLDFFLHELEDAGINVDQVENFISLSEDGFLSVDLEVAILLADIEPGLIEEILNLVEEFRVRRPEVIHAWQDASSIKAGIAAVIVGVPHIVLASRNVTPVNFTYYADYMYPAYRALASLEGVTFLNNSVAGADDYTRWLNIPRERFTVIRNGVNLEHLKRMDAKSVLEYRKSLGIPEHVQVVGSVFRFWSEKRPLFWLQAAAYVAKIFPEVHFLVIGDGPMRADMEVFIKRNHLNGRVHLPGVRSDIAMPLAAMNVFALTSEFEGTPNVILEAQWMGLPVVSTDAGGAQETFMDGETGLLATNATPDCVGNLIVQCLLNPNLKDNAMNKGPDFVRREYGLERMTQETLSLYGLQNK